MAKSINPLYEKEKAVVRDFLHDGCAVLGQILTQENAEKLKQELQKEKKEKKLQPDAFSYQSSKTPLFAEMMVKAVVAFMSEVTQTVYIAKHITTRYFSQGDFLLQHASKPQKGWKLVLFITENWDEAFRGELTVARQEPLIITPQDNMLAFINTDFDDRIFVKKVTYYAKENGFWLISADVTE